MTDFLYRIVGLEDWETAQKEGRVPRCGADDRDGFVHLSTQANYLETADLYFEPAEQPVALEIDPTALGDALKWERVETRGGAEFPHLYAPGIPTTAVRAVLILAPTASGFVSQKRTLP